MDMQAPHKKSIISDTKGFTLMEMLVAVFVFTIVVVAMFNLFMIAQRSQRTAASLENLQDDMRFSLNRIADEVRDGSIDYAYYGSNGDGVSIDAITGGTTVLAIKTFSGVAMKFKAGTGANGDCFNPGDTTILPETKRCLLIKENDTDSWHSLNSDGVSVASSDLKFYISPATDPFIYNETTKKYNSDMQPRVRIVLVGSSKIRPTDTTRVSVQLQTLIATREYRR